MHIKIFIISDKELEQLEYYRTVAKIVSDRFSVYIENWKENIPDKKNENK